MKQKFLLLSVFFMMLCLASIGQTTIKGVVKDSSGNGISGVSVQVKGTQQGTVTKSNGEYSIVVQESNVSLEFSFVGYATQTMAINGRSDFNVVLLPSSGEMEAVVVIGYGTQKKKDLTGSVAVIGAADIANRPIVNAGEALQGKAAGVQVTSVSGKPGAGLSIRVRGASSISAGNDPLYVVDGIPMTDIASYNPNDIESISILKDAASAAIYGTRAANGVVVITTKKGKSGQSRIDVSSYYGVTSPTKKLSVLNASQYQDYMNETGITTITDSMVQANDINWLDEAFRTGSQQNYQVAFSGGSEKTQHYISFDYNNQKGTIRPAKFERMSGRINLTTKAADWLTLSTATTLSRSNNNDITDNAGVARGGVVLTALGTPPTVGLYDKDSGYIGINKASGWENPLKSIIGQQTKNRTDRLVTNFTAEVKLYKDLKYQARLGIDYSNYLGTYYLDPFLTDYGRNQRGSLTQTTSTTMVWLSEQTLNYTHNWGSHHFAALAGWSAQESKWNQTYISASQLPREFRLLSFNEMFIHTQNKGFPTKSIDEWGLMSMFGRVTYDYMGKYLLQANLRSDRSSKFAPGNRTATFPSVSAGWRISQEEFMKEVKVLNDLKLRASWAQNGNQEGIGSYARYSLTNLTNTGDPSGAASIAPETLTWETSTQTNIGVDAVFLNRRLNFTADYYVKNTKDVLVNIPVGGGVVSDVLLNRARMKNTGLEIAISSKNIVKRDFSWNSDFNISFNKNKVVSIGGDISNLNTFGEIYERGYSIRLANGRGLGEFYGYVAAGVDPATGDQLYLDKDGKAVNGTTIRPSDRQYLGTALPDFVYGMTNSVSYKNFDFTVFIQGSQGNDIYNGVRVETEGMKDSRNQSTAVLRRWRKPGDVTDIPRVIAANNDNTLISSRFVENGSYLRFKTITLSYRFDPKLINRLGLGSASLYISGQNLITITKYTGFDPEVSTYGTSNNSNMQKNVSLGIDYGAYPQSKVFMVGLNVSLK